MGENLIPFNTLFKLYSYKGEYIHCAKAENWLKRANVFNDKISTKIAAKKFFEVGNGRMHLTRKEFTRFLAELPWEKPLTVENIERVLEKAGPPEKETFNLKVPKTTRNIYEVSNQEIQSRDKIASKDEIGSTLVESKSGITSSEAQSLTVKNTKRLLEEYALKEKETFNQQAPKTTRNIYEVSNQEIQSRDKSASEDEIDITYVESRGELDEHYYSDEDTTSSEEDFIFERQALLFYGIWQDFFRHTPPEKKVILKYFVRDGTVELVENNEERSVLIEERTITVKDGERDRILKLEDIRIGEIFNILGNRIHLYDCDIHTKMYFEARFGIRMAKDRKITLKCFSCGGLGHKADICPVPGRNVIKCYACKSQNHIFKDCPAVKQRFIC